MWKPGINLYPPEHTPSHLLFLFTGQVLLILSMLLQTSIILKLVMETMEFLFVKFQQNNNNS